MNVNDALIQKYKVKTTKVETKHGCWNHLLCEIFMDDVKIGEYKRNYACMYDTFHPFEQDGKHFALYSKDYTATRVMSLPDCKDLCGENPNGFGFCPTGYAVPLFDYAARDPNPSDPTPYNPRHDNSSTWVVKIPKDGRVSYTRPGDKDYTGTRTKEEWNAACDKFDKEYEAWDKRNSFVERPSMPASAFCADASGETIPAGRSNTSIYRKFSKAS